MATGDDKARNQAFEIPFPRRWQGFIKIVDGENLPPLRRRKTAEIGQVTIAAGLHPNPGGGQTG